MPTAGFTLDSNLTGLNAQQRETSPRVLLVGRDEAIGQMTVDRPQPIKSVYF